MYVVHERGIEHALRRPALEDADVPHVQCERRGGKIEHVPRVDHEQARERRRPRADAGLKAALARKRVGLDPLEPDNKTLSDAGKRRLDMSPARSPGTHVPAHERFGHKHARFLVYKVFRQRGLEIETVIFTDAGEPDAVHRVASAASGARINQR